MRCKGILAKQGAEWTGTFCGEVGRCERFYLPVRCDNTIEQEDDILCKECTGKLYKTEDAPKTRKTIEGAVTQYLNGVVGEPFPFWSRMAGSTWFLQKLKVGRYVTKEDMGRVKKAEKAAFGAEPQPAPEPFGGAAAAEPVAAEPVKKAKSVRFPKKAEEAPPPAVAEPKKPKAAGHTKKGTAAAATTATAPEPVAAPPPAPLEGPVAIVEAKPAEEVSTILRIQVKKTEIQGRSVYLEPIKDKVYDTKFRYLGRFDRKEGKIVSFPDSDQER